MSKLLNKIRSRGYWEVIIRPTSFIENRVPDISGLYSLVANRAVLLRGWGYPEVQEETRLLTDSDWVGQELEWEEYLEIWRLYQSGQFVHIFGMEEDWRDQSTVWANAAPKPGEILGLGNALFTYTEIFEFAARLSLTDASDQTMHIAITVNGLRGRSLVDQRPGAWPLHCVPANLDSHPFKKDVPQAELIANAWELALEPASELFHRFEVDFSKGTLRALQAKLRR